MSTSWSDCAQYQNADALVFKTEKVSHAKQRTDALPLAVSVFVDGVQHEQVISYINHLPVTAYFVAAGGLTIESGIYKLTYLEQKVGLVTPKDNLQNIKHTDKQNITVMPYQTNFKTESGSLTNKIINDERAYLETKVALTPQGHKGYTLLDGSINKISPEKTKI
ncbi:MAG: hypothetical protein ACKOW9_03435 [Candidatus Paceibacterota bacterium]